MRRFRLLLLLIPWLFAAAPTCNGATLSATDKDAIRHVIQDQLAAFQKDDGAAALAFATPALRERFGTPENFMHMVREGYKPVYRPNQVVFAQVEEMASGPVQHVLLVGADGVVHEALYFMEHQSDGKWLIGGCLLVDSELKST